MTLLLQAYLLERYGPRLTVEEIAQALKMARATVYAKISDGTLGIHTYMDNGRRFADAADVAEYLHACRERGRAEAA